MDLKDNCGHDTQPPAVDFKLWNKRVQKKVTTKVTESIASQRTRNWHPYKDRPKLEGIHCSLLKNGLTQHSSSAFLLCRKGLLIQGGGESLEVRRGPDLTWLYWPCTAPMACWIVRMSPSGPASRAVPVSRTAGQPP